MTESQLTVDMVIQSNKVCFSGDLLQAALVIEGGKIVSITSVSNAPSSVKKIDATDKLVIPGAIDTHCHIRDPGFTNKEDFETATKAAAAGGVTTVVDMPNVNPPTNTLVSFLEKREIAKSKAVVDFGHNAAGTLPDEIPKLAQAGAMGFKIFMIKDVRRDYPHMPGLGVDDEGKLMDIFKVITKTNLTCLVHPYSQSIAENVFETYWKEGRTGPEAYAESGVFGDSVITNSAIASLIMLQRATGVKLHILHMSSKTAWDLVRYAKTRGQDVTTEVNPMHLYLGTMEQVAKQGPFVLGTIATDEDKLATYQALNDRTADIIGTDHAPHTKSEKEQGWKDMWKAPGGAPEIEHYISLLFTDVSAGLISLKRVVELCCEMPARRFSIFPKKGILAIGADADITIIDMNLKHKISSDRLYTKCGWTPYEGVEVSASPITTISRGTVVMKDGDVVGKPSHGEFVSPSFH